MNFQGSLHRSAAKNSLTLEEVREAAEKYFDLENYVRVVLLPEQGEG